MIVGGQHHVESRVAQSLRIGVGGAEAGIARIVRISAKRHLKIAYCVIGLRDGRGYEREAVGVVISPAFAEFFGSVELVA